ncbi:SpoVR family protein, partial [Alicyclobacillus fastidiosus]
MNHEEMAALEASIDEMTSIAKDFGLDFYPMRYEVCPSDVIYTFGAYGMPTRFHHWSFGKTKLQANEKIRRSKRMKR